MMNKGYILVYTLCILLSFTSILSIKYTYTKSYLETIKASEIIMERLKAEKAILDEILYYLYVYDDDDIEFYYEDYNFFVEIDDEVVKIDVSGQEEYTITLKYNDDCVCFVEILYD